MTPQEAIEYNKNLKEYMRITDKDSEYKFLKENYEALDMAIKALESQPCEDTLDRIITQIEQVRDKDKLCEYPYNRCINILMDTAPKRKAAIERQVIVTWFTPEEKLPEEDIGVLATVTARAKNREFIRAILTVFYCKSEGWYELDYGFSELTVHAWCDLEPYEGD